MKQLTIQIILIVGTLAVSWRLLMSYGQKALALRRLGLLALAAFAVWSILDPNVWTRLANTVGVGRGSDLILYSLVVAFFGYVVTTYKRFRDMEIRYTRLARRIALDETPPPTRHPAIVGAPDAGASPPSLDAQGASSTPAEPRPATTLDREPPASGSRSRTES